MIYYIEHIIHIYVYSESRFSDPQTRSVRTRAPEQMAGSSVRIEAVRLLSARGQVRVTDSKVGSYIPLALGNGLT